MRKRIHICVLLLISAIVPTTPLAHTSATNFIYSTITGLSNSDIGRDFEFLDGNGKLRRLSDLHGNVVAVFFGFTNCPDICPGFLSKFSVISEFLGSDSERLKVLFVTIDPQRDTRVVLNNYLDLFGKNVIGARIPGGELSKLTRDFAIATQLAKDATGRVVINHTAGFFLFDTHGVATAYLSDNNKIQEIVGNIATLIEKGTIEDE